MTTVHFLHRCLFVFCGLMLSLSLPAQSSRVDSIDIHVVLNQDGSAFIRENWHIQVENDITEWYLVLGNLGKMEITDFSVSDDNGKKFIAEKKWDIDRSREEKAGRCGIVDKGSDGYELCWGVGSPGSHSYMTSYKLSRLVKAYSNADGFNHMFVARGVSPSPQKVRLTISAADTLFSYKDTQIWAFGYIGGIALNQGCIVAESSEPFKKNSSLIVMAQFKNGLFQPEEKAKSSFDKVKERAFEDSDYYNGKSSLSREDKIAIGTIAGIIVGIPLLSYLIYLLVIYFRRLRMVGRGIDLGDRKDLPDNRSLLKAYTLLNYLSYSKINKKHLLQAYLLHLIARDILEVHTVNKPGGFTETYLKVLDWNDNGVKGEDSEIESILYKMILIAADEDKTLRPNDLENIKDEEWGLKLYHILNKKISITNNDCEEAKQLFGLKQYFKLRTEISRLSLSEMSIWKQYLVYAALFGCSKAVLDDLEKICPDITQLLHSNSSVNGKDNIGTMSFYPAWNTLFLYSSFFHHHTTFAYEQEQQRLNELGANRNAGLGGGASFGGGGGFSGGGFGGGGR